jgi:hypothetical protein
MSERTTTRGIERGKRVRVKRDGRRSEKGTVISVHTSELYVDYRADRNGCIYMTALGNVALIQGPRFKQEPTVW